MSPGDPTDNALAAIASILDQPETRRESERLPVDEPPIAPAEARFPIAPVQPSELHSPIEAHGYTKVGPGPMAAIRFKWAVRADHSDYYVDETIGDNSTPVIFGPMTREAAIAFVDDREADARRRFEQLKSEMTGRGATARLVRGDQGEA